MPDIVTGKIFVDGEKGITSTKMNQIISQAVIQPDFVTTKPASSTLDPTDQLIEVKNTGAYAKVTGQQLSDSVASSPSITAMRLRSFNAIGNSTFECDQRNAGAALTNVANGAWLQDRYQLQKTGTMTINGGQTTGLVLLPGTNFTITRCFQRITLTAQEASLAAGDFLYVTQWIEGPSFRELFSDVHSVSLLVRSSVAGLKFGLTIGDAGTATTALTKLCTIPSANTWTLIQLSNLPVFPGGNFSTGSGVSNQFLRIVLAAGSSVTAPANDVWGGVFSGALGQDNFASKPVNSTFDVAFIQWEPGPVSTTLMDKPFTANLDECLRYFCKSYDYATKPGSIVANGLIGVQNPVATVSTLQAGVQFKKPMAKAPTVITYSNSSGAANTIRWASADLAVSAITWVGENGWSNISVGSNQAVGTGQCHYTADTGW